MTVSIQYIDMPESESLSAIVTRNLHKLAHKYQFIIRGDVYFKLGQGTDGNNKICEIKLSVPGPQIFAKTIENNFEKSAAENIGDLERQLRKRKEKFNRRKKAI